MGPIRYEDDDNPIKILRFVLEREQKRFGPEDEALSNLLNLALLMLEEKPLEKALQNPSIRYYLKSIEADDLFKTLGFSDEPPLLTPVNLAPEPVE